MKFTYFAEVASVKQFWLSATSYQSSQVISLREERLKFCWLIMPRLLERHLPDQLIGHLVGNLRTLHALVEVGVARQRFLIVEIKLTLLLAILIYHHSIVTNEIRLGTHYLRLLDIDHARSFSPSVLVRLLSGKVSWKTGIKA